MTREDRTLQMEENFIDLHNVGMPATEIAKRYGLAASTVYRALPRIAEVAGVPRESLLLRTRSTKSNAKTSTRAGTDEENNLAARLDTVVDEAADKIDENKQLAEQEAATRVERKVIMEAEPKTEPSGQDSAEAFHDDYLRALDIMRSFKTLVKATLEKAANYNTRGDK